MALAEVRDLEKAYAGRSVLKGISFDLQKGERIGLVGPNGSGKTTLLKIIAGVEQPDQGAVFVAKSCKLAYVSQIPNLDPEQTLHHQVSLVFEEVHEIERQLHQAAEDLAKHPAGPEHDAAIERYSRLETEFNHMQGYDIARRVDAVLHELGFAQRDLDTPIKLLSGGQKSRAQLARLLLEGPDLMLLDEPTNHLDLPMLDWLENTIAEMEDTALVVVSHDRYFLDSVVDEIFDMVDGKIDQYPSNYSGYTELRKARHLTQERQYKQQQAYIAKEEEYIRRFRAGQRATQARGRKKRLDRLKAGGMSGLVETTKLIQAVHRDGRKVTLNLEVKKPSGIDVLKVHNLSKNYPGKPLFQNLDLHLIRGKRTGIIGPNGSGKSTLLNILAGENTADTGDYRWGHGVKLEFFRQEHQTLNLENTVLEEFQAAKITANQQEMRDLAGLLLFSGDTVEKKVSVLSGGERARVALGKMLLNPSNTIFMDEPTNHLDMPTCDVLEAALDSYDGTMLIISHDRYFLDQVVDQLLVIRPTHLPGVPWKVYQGSYTDYLAAVTREKAAFLAQREQDRKEKAAQETRAAEETKRSAAREQSRVQAKEGAKKKMAHKFAKMSLQEIEKAVAKLEESLANLEASFGNPKVAAHPQAMRELKAKYDQGKKDLAEHMAAWEIKGEQQQ